MRRKKKIIWELSHPATSNLRWWKGEWIESEWLDVALGTWNGSSWYRYVKHAKRAYYLLETMPKGSTLGKYYWKNGQKCYMEWIRSGSD